MPKTKDAFALYWLTDETLFDFKSVYAMSKEGTKARSKMRAACFDGMLKLNNLEDRIMNHTYRIHRYQKAIRKKYIHNGEIDTKTSKKFLRANVLLNLYDSILTKVRETFREISFLLEDINCTEKESFIKFFADRLKMARKQAGLTQDELAKRIGVKRSTYGQFEQGRNEPNISILPALSRELNQPMQWFLGE